MFSNFGQTNTNPTCVNPKFETLQFYCRGHRSNGMVGLVYSTVHLVFQEVANFYPISNYM